MSTHQICQNWILDHTELQPEDERILNEHLIECTECSTLRRNVAQSVLFLQNAEVKKPAAGFTERWKLMKAQREAEKQQLFKIRVIFGLVGALGILSMAFCFLFFLPSNFSHNMLKLSQLASSAVISFGKLKMLLNAFKLPLLGISLVFFTLLLIYAFALLMSALSSRQDRLRKENVLYEEE